jgi:hypothetical protein|tara:strand:+ start:2560 stop:2685 length:126 start_codon:yes stop_codon:yes gene_type:complete
MNTPTTKKNHGIIKNPCIMTPAFIGNWTFLVGCWILKKLVI